jgi:hypothetical protein
VNANENHNSAERLTKTEQPLRGEDVVEEIRRVRKALLEKAGGDLHALFYLVQRRAKEIRSPGCTPS